MRDYHIFRVIIIEVIKNGYNQGPCKHTNRKYVQKVINK